MNPSWLIITYIIQRFFYFCLFVYVPSTARSFRDGTPVYCPLRRTRSSVNTPFPTGIEPWAVAWQSITLPLRHASSLFFFFLFFFNFFFFFSLNLHYCQRIADTRKATCCSPMFFQVCFWGVSIWFQVDWAINTYMTFLWFYSFSTATRQSQSWSLFI